MTFRAVAVEPVNAILSTPLRASAAPVSPMPGDQLQHRLLGHDLGERADQPAAHRRGELARLEDTALPAASAYAIEPIGVKTG